MRRPGDRESAAEVMARSIAQTNALLRERDDYDAVALALHDVATGSAVDGGACLGKCEYPVDGVLEGGKERLAQPSLLRLIPAHGSP